MHNIIDFWYRKMEGKWAHYLSHFMGGFMLATVVSKFAGIRAGAMVGIGASILKEVIDKYSRLGSPEALAAVITSIGVAVAIILKF